MSAKEFPPSGWQACQSQNLHRPWSCERVQQATGPYPTEGEAIAAAWEIEEEGEVDEVEMMLARFVVECESDEPNLRRLRNMAKNGKRMLEGLKEEEV